MTNPFNAPQKVVDALPGVTSKLAVAVLALGPRRIQWNGGKHPKQLNGNGGENMWAAWDLDGKNAKVRDIINAADEAALARSPSSD